MSFNKNENYYPHYISTSHNELSVEFVPPTMPLIFLTDTIPIFQNSYEEDSSICVESWIKDAKIYSEDLSARSYIEESSKSFSDSIEESSEDLQTDLLNKKKIDWNQVGEYIALNPFPVFFYMKSDHTIDEMLSSRILNK